MTIEEAKERLATSTDALRALLLRCIQEHDERDCEFCPTRSEDRHVDKH